MSEVEPKSFRRNERTSLGNVMTKHLPESGVKEVGRRVIPLDGPTTRCIDDCRHHVTLTQGAGDHTYPVQTRERAPESHVLHDGFHLAVVGHDMACI